MRTVPVPPSWSWRRIVGAVATVLAAEVVLIVGALTLAGRIAS